MPTVLDGRLRRFGGLVVVVLGVVTGLGVPVAGSAVAGLSVPLVALLVFATLHGTDVRGRSLGATGEFVAWTLALCYGLVPAAVALAAGAFDPAVGTALVVVAAAPTTAGSALVWTVVAEGDDLLATVGALATLVVAPVAIPVVLTLLVGRGVSVPAVPLVRDLLLMVGGGAVLARLVPASAVGAEGRRSLSLAVIFLLVYGSVANSPVVGSDPVALAGVAAVAVGVLGLVGAVAVAGRRLGRWDRETALALWFVGPLKNLGVSLAVVAALGLEGAGVPVATFYGVQQVAASALAGGLADRGRG